MQQSVRIVYLVVVVHTHITSPVRRIALPRHHVFHDIPTFCPRSLDKSRCQLRVQRVEVARIREVVGVVLLDYLEPFERWVWSA